MVEETAASSRQGAVSERAGLEKNALGAGAIIFIVVAFSAPISVVVGSMPLAFGFGNGIGVPGTYLISGLVLLCFVAGYAAMSRHVVNAGAFYAYITRGLGREVGGAAAFVALVAYACLTIAVCVVFGYFAASVFLSLFSVHVAWWIYSAAALLVVGLLGYRSVDISAKVLGVALVLELVMITVLDIGVLVKNGPSAFTLSAFNPSHIFSGQTGVGFVYAFLSYLGIEATAIFSEEARNPARTIPRASYGAVSLICAVYVFTSWSLLGAYGATNVQAAAAKTPSLFAFGASLSVLGKYPTDIMQVLLVSSLFAVILAAHNSTARYTYSMGRARLLPAGFGRSHPRWQSPYFGSLLMTVLTAVAVAAVAIKRGDPYLGIGAPMLALATVGIMSLQAVASVSIFVFFRRIGDRRPWTTIVAPLLAGAGLGTAIVLILRNYSMVTGTPSRVANDLPWILVLAAAVGLAVVFYLKTANRTAYRRLGAEAPERELYLAAEIASQAAD